MNALVGTWSHATTETDQQGLVQNIFVAGRTVPCTPQPSHFDRQQQAQADAREIKAEAQSAVRLLTDALRLLTDALSFVNGGVLCVY
jgi:hypothetical protein